MFRARKFMQLLVAVVAMSSMALSSVGTQPSYARNNATTAATWYVSPTGLDANTCAGAEAPCLTINAAIAKAASGDTIDVAIGMYTPGNGAVASITKNITLSGGWNADFTAQTGVATIDGLAAFRGVTISDGLIVTIDHFVIQHGADGSQGGGINNRGTLTLANSVVSNNSSGWMGGGINVYGTLTVNNSTISNNRAGSGGSGGGGGGAIEVYGGSSTATLNNTTLSGNQIIGSYSGSAIDTGGPLYLNNTTISGNTGAYAIATFVGHVILNNTTVTGNSGGISNNSGVVSLRNSILAGNSVYGGPANCSGAIGTVGYNLIGIQNPGCAFTADVGDKVGTTVSPIDPKLGPLADNGGPTFTHALLVDSPAIDGGSPAQPGSGGSACLAADQRGMLRPLLTEGTCDMGSYESQLPLVISINRADPNPTTAAEVAFVATFTSPVTGVDITDFALTTSGITGASVVGVTGSADAYSVTVNTGTGNGTIRLDVIDDDTIQDAASTKSLGGPGLGNGNFAAGQNYTIQGPQVTAVNRADPSPTSAASVNFSLTFSRPVSGVDTNAPFSDFALTTTDVAGASIAAVSGSGNAYVVTVNTGAGNGTIRLDVIDDDSIVDASSGKPLGGPGIGNGSFTAGQLYTLSGRITSVSSVDRASPNPTSASTAQYTVRFSRAVTGVNTAPPFDDLALTTTGVTGATITAVSGSGTEYTVTISTGYGNGTIRLDVIDNDSILDTSNYPLGGPGVGNGSFTSGQVYSVQKIPLVLSPTNTIWDTTPTYKWSKIPGATQYRYQLIKGTAIVYTKTVLANVCGTACSNTPTTLLVPGVDKWRVQAQLRGVWTNYCAYKTFTLIAPKAGAWKGSGLQFYVTPSRVSVDNFAIYITVNGCGSYKITNNPLVPINAGNFSFGGRFFANGSFSSATVSPTRATGSLGLSSFYIPGCGYVSGGPYPWSALWNNVTQPSAASTQDLNSVLVLPALSTGSESGSIWSVSPEP